MFWCRVGVCHSYCQLRRHRRRACTVPRRPSPSTCHHAVPWCRVAVAPSIAVHRRPSPSIATPSITAKSPSCGPYPSITIAIAVHRRRASAVPHRTSPSKSRRAIHRLQRHTRDVCFSLSMALTLFIILSNSDRIPIKKTLAARGLEEPRNSQELLTESVDLTKFVGPLPFSVKK